MSASYYAGIDEPIEGFHLVANGFHTFEIKCFQNSLELSKSFRRN